MLKKLRIVNFESHKDTTIEFSNGFNVFQGDSNGGKSSIIRAISAVCYNKWSNESVRVGETQTVIQLTTDLGFVKLIKNPKEKINAYSCKKFETNEDFYFQSVGTTVPPIVSQLTGMRQLNIGDSITDVPNIMYQLQKHYMLAQVSGKSCTSNLVARIFDKVIGLGGMQELINQISSSMLSQKKSVTKYISQVQQLKSKLIPQQIIQQKQVKLEKITKLRKQISDLKQKFQFSNSLMQQFEKYNEKLKQLDYNLIDFDVESCVNQMNDIVSLKQKCCLANDLVVKNESQTNAVAKIQQFLSKCVTVDKQKIDQVKQLCNKLYLSNKIINQYFQKKQKMLNSDQILNKLQYIDEFSRQLEVLKSNCNSLYKTNKLLQKSGKFNADLIATQNQIKIYEAKSTEIQNKLMQLKKQCKVCPLCGKAFDCCND